LYLGLAWWELGISKWIRELSGVRRGDVGEGSHCEQEDWAGVGVFVFDVEDGELEAEWASIDGEEKRCHSEPSLMDLSTRRGGTVI
jgi:hypothetical protein